ncbi:hypothetical protein [Altericroceibacterium xinjiangense]|uniref:hypothetical protein n=1 Tax=Altericroceibacterium xinjiangense TaxID=762261 RepID=UPI000F7EB88C|nr:hypothetical protein [Altericroceibacterium xinjiangense]
MNEVFQENWILFLIAILVAIALAWWLFVASRRTRVETTRTDPLEKDAAPPKRNQALIDSAPAAAAAATEVMPAAPIGLAGVGQVVAAATDANRRQEPVANEPAEPVKETPPELPPVQVAEPEPAVASTEDDLKRIKGVGPKLETLLRSIGVNSFAQIAAWDEADIDRIDTQLGRFQGRIRRDHWIEQARFLAEGDKAGFEDRFGKV